MDKQTIIAKAKEEFYEFVAMFGHLLETEWIPEEIIRQLKDTDGILAIREDEVVIDEEGLIDVDYKSLCVTFVRNNDKVELSSWVEVWDDCKVIGFLANGIFKENTGRY